MFGFYLLEAYSLLMRDRKQMDPEGREGEKEPRGVEGRWRHEPPSVWTGKRGTGLSACSTQPTRPDRGWFVAPFGKNPWWVYPASILPALLVTILIFMDQQITAVIVNRKENKLRVRLRQEHSWGSGGGMFSLP